MNRKPNPLTTPGLASAVLVRYNELAGVLAAHTSCLLKAAGVGDETATLKHRQHIVRWCRENLEPTLELLLKSADLAGAGDPVTAAEVAERVRLVRSAADRLARESGERRIAVGAIRLRVRLHGLMRLVDDAVLAQLVHTPHPRFQHRRLATGFERAESVAV